MTNKHQGWQPIASAPPYPEPFDVWVPSNDGGYRVTDLYLSPRKILLKGGVPADLPRWPTHWRAQPSPPECEV